MEERIKQQIDVVIKELEQKENNLASEYKSFKDSVFTKEVKEMFDTIYDYMKGSACECYCYLCECGHEITMKYSYNPDICIDEDRLYFTPHHVITREEHISRKYYDDETIRLIRRHTDILLSQKRLLKIFADNATEIVKDIAKQYDEITGRQIDSLNTVIEMLDFEEKPLKHIKITVEYI